MSVDDENDNKKTMRPVAPAGGGFQFSTAPKPKQLTPNGENWNCLAFWVLLAVCSQLDIDSHWLFEEWDANLDRNPNLLRQC